MLLEKFLTTRTHTEKLCAPLEVEDFGLQAAAFASPAKWHLAHTSWFFEEIILKKHLTGYRSFDKKYSLLFNSYYQTLGKPNERAQRGVLSRPSVKEIFQYRRHIDEHIAKLISDRSSKAIEDLIILGMNHEQQHQELILTDQKFVFALNPIDPIYDPDFCLVDDVNGNRGWVEMDAGLYDIGHRGDGFHFCNEAGAHQVQLQDYKIFNSLVTNGEYFEFIEDGAYAKFQYWLDDGWTWVQQNQIESPLYWRKTKGDWSHFTLAGLKPIIPKAVLSHVSYYEAQAFANWKGCRLPSEFEWEAAAEKLVWGSRWEWTASAYHPYPRYKTLDGALGEYNGKFMANQMVLRGASRATPIGHSRVTYRNFFHPQHQWQFSGIRLAQDK